MSELDLPTINPEERTYWKEDIIPNDKTKEKIFLGISPPKINIMDNCYKIIGYTGSIDDNLFNDIRNFSSCHNFINTSTITIITPDVLCNILEMEGLISVCYRFGDVVGIIATVPVQLRWRKKTKLKSTYTTHLIVHTDYRNKGIAARLIEYNTNTFGKIHGYYLTTSKHHRCSVKVKTWCRPIKLKECHDMGYYIKENYASKRVKMSYRCSTNKYTYRNSLEKDTVKLKEWNTHYLRWSKPIVYNSITIVDDSDVPVAIVHITDHKILMEGVYIPISLLTYVCFLTDNKNEMKHIFTAICSIANDRESYMIYGYCIGTLSDPSIRSAFKLSDSQDYQILEFYNSNISINLELINIPIW